MSTENKLNHCSFCGNHKDNVKKLIVSEEVAICSECVELCNTLMVDEEGKNEFVSDDMVSYDPESI